MPVTFDSVGSVQYVTGVTTLDVTTPAGSSGDLVIFFLSHDDYSDGAFVPNTPPVTLNTLHDGSPQLEDDSRQAIFWGIENQAGARAYTFDWTTTEEAAGICLRFSGQHGTPIQAGSITRVAARTVPPNSGNNIGDMFVCFLGADTGFSTTITPANWTLRVDNVGGTGAFIHVITRPVDTYPLPQAFENNTLELTGHTAYSFVITSVGPTWTISGVTKDKDGSSLATCEVALFKEVGGSPPTYAFAGSTTSDGSGNYSFTVHENPAKFMVYSIKDDTPHVFDVTDNVLTPL